MKNIYIILLLIFLYIICNRCIENFSVGCQFSVQDNDNKINISGSLTLPYIDNCDYSCNDNNDCGDDYICNSSSGFKCCTKKDEPLIVCNSNATPPETCPGGSSCPKCNSNTCCCPPIK